MKILSKILFSILIGIAFFYLAAKDIQFNQLSWSGELHLWHYILFFVIAFIIITVLRAYRLYVILKRLGNIKIKQVVAYTFVGYLFIAILPLRLGELIIPYLVNKDANISLTSTLSSIMFIRFVDLFTVMILLIFIFFNIVVPDWLLKSNIIFISFMVIGSLIFMITYKHSHLIWKLLLPIVNLFPEKLHDNIKHILKGFKNGFEVVKEVRIVSIDILISFVVVIFSTLSVYVLLQFLNMPSNLFISLTVVIINLIGLSLPAGPGMIGNFQYSCMIALGLFNIEENSSFVFANIYYILAIGLTIVSGIFFLPMVSFSFYELKTLLHKKINRVENQK
ncbi:MAG: flippase-like domain-containing protein [Leptospiraceae bacterium]|nr:flippase-like domain-containing protein [Leptospiraceae bacterium]